MTRPQGLARIDIDGAACVVRISARSQLGAEGRRKGIGVRWRIWFLVTRPGHRPERVAVYRPASLSASVQL